LAGSRLSSSAAADPAIARRQLAWLSLAMLLGMTLWFSATAATGQIVAEFHLTSGTAAWLTMAVQAGFVIGTLASALLNLPDVVSARQLFGAGCLCGAAANAGLVGAPDASTLIALRVATGVSLAWVYPPGMKVAAGWFEERRGAALGFLIAALTIGSAFPHALSAMAAAVPWRVLMLTASALAVAGGGIVTRFVGDGPYVARSARFEAGAVERVFADRGTRLATLGYLGHMWELYAMWGWIAVVFAAAAHWPRMKYEASAAAIIAIGAVGCVWAGRVSDRLQHAGDAGRIAQRAKVTIVAMSASAACCVLAALVYDFPMALLIVALIWGIAVIADSAQFSAIISEVAEKHYIGTALTLQTALGFLLTAFSIRATAALASHYGWQWALVSMAIGPLLGVWAMRGLMQINT
jgi:MFS family permease